MLSNRVVRPAADVARTQEMSVFPVMKATVHSDHVSMYAMSPHTHTHRCTYVILVLSNSVNVDVIVVFRYRGVCTHSQISNITCRGEEFTDFMPCSRSINPNNETCLVTCSVSCAHTPVTCAPTLMCAHLYCCLTQLGYK